MVFMLSEKKKGLRCTILTQASKYIAVVGTTGQLIGEDASLSYQTPCFEKRGDILVDSKCSLRLYSRDDVDNLHTDFFLDSTTGAQVVSRSYADPSDWHSFWKQRAGDVVHS